MKKLMLILSIITVPIHAMDQEAPNQSLLQTMEQWVTDLTEVNTQFSALSAQEDIQADQFEVVAARYVSIQENIKPSIPENFDDEKAVADGIIKREDLSKLNASLKHAIELVEANIALCGLCAIRFIMKQ
jgi:hypothetical protein